MTRTLCVLAGLAALLAAVSACAFSGDDDGGGGQEVQVPLPADGKVEYGEDGNLIETTDFATAMKKLEDRVGFDVVLPTAVPNGFVLTALASILVPAEVDPSRFPKAYVVLGNEAGATITIIELNRRVEAVDDLQQLDAPTSGSQLSPHQAKGGSLYTLRLADRTFLVQYVRHPAQATDRKVEIMITALARAADSR